MEVKIPTVKALENIKPAGVEYSIDKVDSGDKWVNDEVIWRKTFIGTVNLTEQQESVINTGEVIGIYIKSYGQIGNKVFPFSFGTQDVTGDWTIDEETSEFGIILMPQYTEQDVPYNITLEWVDSE